MVFLELPVGWFEDWHPTPVSAVADFNDRRM